MRITIRWQILPLVALLCTCVERADAWSDCAATLDGLRAQRGHPAYGQYAYKVEDHTGNAVTVERFDPSLPAGQRWELLSVDNRLPTEKEIERVRKHRALAQDGYRHDSLFDEASMDSIAPVELLGGRQRYAFRPVPEAGEDETSRAFTSQLRGELIFEQDPDCYIEYRLRNERPVKPGRGVKIRVFELTIRLKPLAGSDVFYPAWKSQTITGKAFLVKSIDQQSETRYTEHEMVTQD